MSARAIVVDWGTTAFRAWLIERDGGAVLDEISDGKGLLELSREDFPGYCRRQLTGWRDGGGPPIYMAGMVGSAQGWQTAPQPPVPIDLPAIAAATVPAEGLEAAWILPGCRRVDSDGVPDVMRGEEVQIMGALSASDRRSAVLCLPGTHSKWAWARDGALVDFTTSMTGEVYGLLLDHSLLARSARRDAPWQEAAFRRGLAQSALDGGLLHHLFTTRSRDLAGELAPDEAPSYLSGLLIGHELAAMAPRIGSSAEPILLVGAAKLKRPYEVAMSARDWRVSWIDSATATLLGISAVIPHIA